jgi:predicted PurR-regulated permease PerM
VVTLSKKNFVYAAIAGAAVVFTAALFFRTDAILTALRAIFRIITPFLAGIAIAFILNGPLCRVRKLTDRMFKKSEKMSAAVAVAAVYILFLALLAGIIAVIIPNLVTSVKTLLENFNTYYDNFIAFYERMRGRDTLGILEKITVFLAEFAEVTPEWVRRTLEKTGGFLTGLLNFVIGFIISIYILAEKESLKKTANEICVLFLPKKKYEIVTKYYTLIFKTFSGFVSGQLAEAFILGSLCYVGMVIFGFDYPLLISVIICITALVPIAGALIGTIPSALLLLLVRPMEAVWFLVFIIILQQIENNFIYPKVVGGALGLPAILVFTAIIIGTGVGGIMGTLLAVPVSAVIYAIAAEYISDRKDAQNMAGENI